MHEAVVSAAQKIIENWSDWEAAACEAGQVQQSDEAFIDTLQQSVIEVLLDLLGSLRPSESALQFAERWYHEDSIGASIANKLRSGDIPTDVSSPEFAKWLTGEFRTALAKGIQIGRDLE